MKVQEQHAADLLRILLKLQLTQCDEVRRMIDELQIRLFVREGVFATTPPIH